jgi:molybdopterin-containing oxidoreductase family membrane subunit
MQAKLNVMGVFPDENKAVSAINALADTSWKPDRVHSPFPSHKISDALKLKKSRVGWFTLMGGITGFFSGFALCIFTVLQWDLIIQGKPVLSWISFVVVGFEFTILFSVIGNVLGLLLQCRLPDYKGLELYDPRCSGEHFGIVASCVQSEKEDLMDLFKQQGGDVKIFN